MGQLWSGFRRSDWPSISDTMFASSAALSLVKMASRSWSLPSILSEDGTSGCVLAAQPLCLVCHERARGLSGEDCFDVRSHLSERRWSGEAMGRGMVRTGCVEDEKGKRRGRNFWKRARKMNERRGVLFSENIVRWMEEDDSKDKKMRAAITLEL
ncbi:uncharacterized protein MONOS_15446 [Monocercomonoides exilis]|uniref:uncharacterized protein n=1 Tax=Monocercomonoides exilis TaxID=2049356 RepID=UPI00355942BD|nr:hypothetical protein MONOS_15446 [Monocercomonoides exilis]|eukprot:MONOS_15446.1-p1 / transcript=MONOS_15446.1 / gene=MONOS_15446 / organism=Monocercomonoides_exilis_PA203 / gene_product=unspecified product / transcript_product=unspecified product / location=Mono_scaffold01233:12773-13237(-) / protein_length=155 / sequence_SO=supercontig / SO=protein_coding / is_pseudo=false